MIQISQSYTKIHLLGSKASDLVKGSTSVINALTDCNESENDDGRDVELINAIQRMAKGCIACKGEHGVFRCPNIKSAKSNPKEM